MAILARNRNLFSGVDYNIEGKYTSLPISGIEWQPNVDSFSISMFVKIKNNYTRNVTLLESRGNLFKGFYITGNNISGGYLGVGYYNGSSTIYAANISDINLQNITHIGCSYTPTRIRLFLNGKKVAEQVYTLATDTILGTRNCNIGGRSVDPLFTSKTIIGDTQIYNFELTENQVYRIYINSGRLLDDVTPIRHYNHNELNGKVLNDVIGGQHGTLQNFTDAEVGIPDQSTNTAWVNAYYPYNPILIP